MFVLYLSLAVKSKQVHFDSNSLRHCLFNDNEASDMSHYDVVRYVSSSFVRIPYKAVITSFRQTFISHSFKCNSSYARLTLSYLSHPTDLTASERYIREFVHGWEGLSNSRQTYYSLYLQLFSRFLSVAILTH